MRVRYTETSAQDLAHSIEYLLERAPSLAAAFADSVDEVVRELLEHPYSAVETEKPGVRRKYIRRFRYRLFYAIYRTRRTRHFAYSTCGTALAVAGRPATAIS